jgi:hypothetical protein
MTKKIAMRAAVLFLGFLVGISVSFLFSVRHKQGESRPVPAIATRIDQWHRLYEAAGMTGDSEIIKEVNDRLMCADSDGELRAVPIETDGRSACRESDGSIQDLKVSPGSFSRLIIGSHLKWSVENSAFVGSVTHKDMARAYVRQHEWPD